MELSTSATWNGVQDQARFFKQMAKSPFNFLLPPSWKLLLHSATAVKHFICLTPCIGGEWQVKKNARMLQDALILDFLRTEFLCRCSAVAPHSNLPWPNLSICSQHLYYYLCQWHCLITCFTKLSLLNSNSIDLQRFISIVLHIRSVLMSTALSLFVTSSWYLSNNLCLLNTPSTAEEHCTLLV